jgi:tRNA-modifying protein YgfZ
MTISANLDRIIISIKGENIEDFLQSIITQDITKQEILYSFMLTAQGKYFTDLFIVKQQDGILIDIPKIRYLEIIQRLKIYILRKKIELNILDDMYVFTSAKKIDFLECNAAFIDPRNSLMGYRYYSSKISDNIICDDKSYHLRRYDLLIAEGDLDLTPDKSFILDFGAEKLNAVSFNKGCYVGQELVSRMHFRNMIKKQVVLISSAEKLAEKNTAILFNQVKIGVMLSSINNIGLALVNKEYLANHNQENNIICNSYSVKINI